MSHETMPGMDHGTGHAGHEMKGFLGPYGMGREGSGTSWQPDTSPHEGIHAQYGDWMTMWHALFNGVYDNQGGPRGDSKTFVSGMVMAMAERQVDASTFGFRAMLSPDPFMGPSGYPLLLATGETADGHHGRQCNTHSFAEVGGDTDGVPLRILAGGQDRDQRPDQATHRRDRCGRDRGGQMHGECIRQPL